MRFMVVVAAVLIAVLAASAYAGTIVGQVREQEQLDQVMRKWKFDVLNNNYLGPFGYFLHCKCEGGFFSFAYTYGEESLDRAAQKALYALKAECNCISDRKFYVHQER